MMFSPRFVCANALALLLPACTSEDGEVEVRAWGEDFIEVGVPAEDLADGWAVRFERFEVELREVSVAGASLDDAPALDLSTPSEGRGQLVGRAPALAGAHSDLRFTLASVSLAGEATKDGVTKRFAWDFPAPASYADCDTATVVPAGGVGALEITVHADHLLYDSLVSEEPALRFDPIADADADGDGEVSQTELELAGLGAYDPGNLDIDDLWSFLAAQAQTMGHVDGEGHCSPI